MENLVNTIALNTLCGLFSGLIIFVVGLKWASIKSFVLREQNTLARLIGRKSVIQGKILVALDTYRDVRLLPPDIQSQIGVLPSHGGGNRFYKTFPDGHITAFLGAFEDVMGYCSARGADYIIDTFSPLLSDGVKSKRDSEVASEWESSFICLGSSASNIKTNDIKHHPDNEILAEDINGKIELKNGESFAIEGRQDKGYILKIANPFFKGYSMIVCAGLGEWGTSGAAFFLCKKWKEFSKRFGKRNFLVVVSVNRGEDQSAEEIYSWAEDGFWHIFVNKLFAQLKKTLSYLRKKTERQIGDRCDMSRKKQLLLWVLLALVLVGVGVFTEFDANYLFFSAFGLLLLSLLEFLSLTMFETNTPYRNLKILCLVLIFSGLTIIQLRDIVKPTFPVRETVQGNDRIKFKNDETDPHKNIYFNTMHDVTAPEALKIKDTFNYLAHMMDFDMLGKRRVFVNYMFGKNEETNKAIASQGFDFVYYTTDWFWSSSYRKYKDRMKELRSVLL